MRIYLAARYSRREELCGYARILEAAGHEITSRWLDGGHQIPPDQEEAVVRAEGERFAREDIEDVRRAECVIAFTEQPREGTSRGGRHVELGLALAWEKRLRIVGPRENVFCWLPEVMVYPTFEDLMACLNHAVREGLL